MKTFGDYHDIYLKSDVLLLAVCNSLPVGKFKWVETTKKNKFMSQILKERKFNFFIECNIEYPEELHDLHNDYPLAPKKIVIDDNFKESPYSKTIREI